VAETSTTFPFIHPLPEHMADIVIQLGIGIATGIAAGAAASGVGNGMLT
jgi:hypothetical protein